MKHLGVVLLLATCLVACAPAQTLDELVYQANLSGDWSVVEKRELLVEKRRSRQGIVCPAGQISYCEARGASQRCHCVDGTNIRDAYFRR